MVVFEPWSSSPSERLHSRLWMCGPLASKRGRGRAAYLAGREGEGSVPSSPERAGCGGGVCR